MRSRDKRLRTSYNPCVRWIQRVRSLKAETFALLIACGDPRTPWYAKVVALSVVAYAFSPIDLIPDFIPGAGYLDDLIIVPLGIAIARRMIPAYILAEARERADVAGIRTRPWRRAIVVLVIVVWLLLVALGVWLLIRLIR